MPVFEIKGGPQLMAAWKRMEEKMRSKVLDLRVQIARELTTSLMHNIPVWSGRTINSIAWGSSPTQNIQPHPTRGGFAIEGPWEAVKAYGNTNKMGKVPANEPMRSAAEAHAMAEVESLYGFFGDKAYLTINSVPWELIERGEAPGGKGQVVRNTAVVSQIALAQVRAKFGGNLL